MEVSVKDERESVAASRFSRRQAAAAAAAARGGGGRILNEPSISGHHPQTNVTDKNGAHDTLVDCMLDKSSATADREKIWGWENEFVQP